MRATALVPCLLLALGAGCAGPGSRSTGGSPRNASAGDGAAAADAALGLAPRYYQATGGSPVYEVLANAGDQVVRIDGEVTIEAIDRAGEDAALAALKSEAPADKASVKGWFRGLDGVRYEFSLDRALPAAPGDPERTHFGGVGTNLRIDGDSGFGRQDEPTRLAGVAIWGIGAVTREGRLVGEYPLRLIVGSRTRTADTGRALGGTDATRREVDQIDLWISSDRGVEASTASTGERTLPAGQPREAEGAVGPLPAFHVVWAHANVKFKPF